MQCASPKNIGTRRMAHDELRVNMQESILGSTIPVWRRYRPLQSFLALFGPVSRQPSLAKIKQCIDNPARVVSFY